MPGGAGTPGGYQGDRDTGSDYGQFDRAASRTANNPSGGNGGNGGNGGSGGKAGIDYKKHVINAGVNAGASQLAQLLGVHPVAAMFVGPVIRRGVNRQKDTSLKTEHKGLRQDPKTGAYYHKAPKHRPPVDHGGDDPGPQMASTSTQAAQPVKARTPYPVNPYYMGFDFQQAKHKLGTSGQVAPDPRKKNTQGWQFKKGGLAGGKRFGPPPKKGPNPHGKCPFRPDGIRGVGAVEKGRGVKFIGTK